MGNPASVQLVNTQWALLAQNLSKFGINLDTFPPQLPADSSNYSNQSAPNAILEHVAGLVFQNPGLVNILAQPALVAVGVVQNPEILKAFVEAVSVFHHADPSTVLQNPEAALKPIIQLIERAAASQSAPQSTPQAPANSKAAGPLAEQFNSLLVRDPNGKPTPEGAREMARFVQSIPVAFHEGILPTVVRLLNQSSTPSDLRHLNDALDNFLALPRELRTEIVRQLEVDRKEAAAQRNQDNVAQNQPTVKSFKTLVQTTLPPTAEFPSGAVPRQLANPVLREMAKILSSVLLEAEVGQWLSEVSVLISASPKGGPIDLAQMVASMRLFVRQIVSLNEPQAAKAVERLLMARSDSNPNMRLLVVTLLKGLVAKGVQSEAVADEYLGFLKQLALANLRRVESMIPLKVRSEAISVLLDLEQHRGRNQEEMKTLINDINLIGTLNKLLASNDAAFIDGISMLKKAWPYLDPSVRNGYVDVALKRAAKSRRDSPLVSAVINLVLTHLKDVGEEQRNRLLEMDLYQATLTEATRMSGDTRHPWSHYAGVVANDNARRQAA